MNINNLIIVPTAFEAEFISTTDTSNFKTLLKTGIGKTSIKSINEFCDINKLSNIILLGFAGTLSSSIKSGSAYSIKTSYFKDESIKLDILNISLETASIVTVKKPIHSETRKKNFSFKAELVDMETFFLANFAKENNINFYSIRVALDDCTNDLINIFKGLSPVPEHIKNAGTVLNKIYQDLTYNN